MATVVVLLIGFGNHGRNAMGHFSDHLAPDRGRDYFVLKQPLHILTTARDTCQQGNRTSNQQPPRQSRRHSTPCPVSPSSLQCLLWIGACVAFEITGNHEVFWHDSPS